MATLLKYLVTLFGFEVRKCFHLIFRPRKCGLSIKHHVSMSIRTHIVTKLSKMGKIWQQCLKIWQPCLYYRFETASMGFLVLKNVVLASTILSMSNRTHIVTKLSKMAIFWQPCLKIWQPCLFYRFENASIGFHVL